jgi:hypothetical protein
MICPVCGAVRAAVEEIRVEAVRQVFIGTAPYRPSPACTDDGAPRA